MIAPEKLRLSEMTKSLPISLYLVPEIYQQCYNIVIGYLKTDKIPQKLCNDKKPKNLNLNS